MPIKEEGATDKGISIIDRLPFEELNRVEEAAHQLAIFRKTGSSAHIEGKLEILFELIIKKLEITEPITLLIQEPWGNSGLVNLPISPSKEKLSNLPTKIIIFSHKDSRKKPEYTIQQREISKSEDGVEQFV